MVLTEYMRLLTLQRINQKLVFNELYNSNPGFLKEEIEFLHLFSTIKSTMTYRKQIASCIQESEYKKMTDYL